MKLWTGLKSARSSTPRSEKPPLTSRQNKPFRWRITCNKSKHSPRVMIHCKSKRCSSRTSLNKSSFWRMPNNLISCSRHSIGMFARRSSRWGSRQMRLSTWFGCWRKRLLIMSGLGIKFRRLRRKSVRFARSVIRMSKKQCGSSMMTSTCRWPRLTIN